MSNLTLNPITYDGLSFTNFSIAETDIGTYASFTTYPGLAQAASTPYGVGIAWGGLNAGVYGANSSEVLNFNYTVGSTSAATLIDSVSQLYTTDTFAGPGISLVAVERITSAAGALLGTDTFTLGATNLPVVTLSSAQQVVNVQITLTMAISSAGTAASSIVISAFQQTFGTEAAPATASIGDIAFVDMDATGLESGFDSGPGLAGVTVELLNSTGSNVLATTTTDAGGRYSFSGLAAGVYEVEFLTPSGYTLSSQGVGSNAAINSSANQTTGITAQITLAAGEADHNVEAGFVPNGSAAGGTATIGNTVWMDANRDGLDDNGEAGAAGVTVELLSAATGSVLSTTTTNSSGNYQFTDLAAALYEVQFVLPSGDSFTAQNVSPGSSGYLNSVVPGSGLTGPITITAGEIDNEVNAGLTVLPATLSGVTFLDNNNNDALDASDTLLAGQTVELLNSAGTIVATTTTNGSGAYSFTNLNPGTYDVAFATPPRDTIIAPEAGFATTGSSANQTTGLSPAITLTAGQSQGNVNAGFVAPLGSIGDFVWQDLNGNGLQDSGEPSVAGATVELLKAGGSVLATTTTNSRGLYNFSNLAAGIYEVQFVAPMGDTFTTPNVGTNPGNDSSAAQATGITAPITLTAGQTDNTIDAGLIVPGSISGVSFLDVNRNDALDASDTLLAGQTVELLNSAGTVIATTTTNSSGAYRFGSLNPGSYDVQFVTPPGDTIVAPGAGFTSTDSTAGQTSGLSPVITLTSGGNQPNVNAGFQVPPADIRSYIFMDVNRDGIMDGSDYFVGGVTVELLNGTGSSVLATTTTNSGGLYSFTNLNPGSYEIEAILPTGDVFAPERVTTAGATINNTSSVNQGTGITSAVTITAGQDDYNVLNVGLQSCPAAITGTAFLDTNRDGISDAGDTVLPSVTVDLWNAGETSVLATTTTDASGNYSFTNLAPGSYEVSFVTPSGDFFTTQGTPFGAADSSANATTGFTPAIVLTAGQTRPYVNAGFQTAPPAAPCPAAIGNFVWMDSNGNGLQDAGEPGVGGVTVDLISDTLTLSISEDAYAGDAQYTISVNGVQIGGTRTATALHAAGADNTVTLNGIWGANPTVVVTFLNDLYGGTAATDRNLYVDGISYNGVNQGKSAALGTNGSVSFALAGPAEPVIATTTTNSSGIYGFSNLNPGVYEEKFVAPAGDALTTPDVGTNPALDSNAAVATGLTAPVTLTAGQTDNTIDAGLIAAGKPGMSVLKLPGTVAIGAGCNETYSFIVTNTGTTALSNVTISDNLGTPSAPWNFTPTLLTKGTNGILAPGQSWTYSQTIQEGTFAYCGGTASCTASGNYLGSGCTAWLSSSFKPANCGNGATYTFSGVTCTISGGGVSSPFTVNCATSIVKFSSGCTSATTVFNAGTNCWTTTLPANCNPGSVFLSGCPVTVPNGCNLSGALVNWSCATVANNCGLSSLNWNGSCVGYANANLNGLNCLTDYNQLGVKACDGLAGYGNGGSCSEGYGFTGSSYLSGGCGGSSVTASQKTFGWQGTVTDCAGTPQNLYTSSNCGVPASAINGYSASNGSCGTGSTLQCNTYAATPSLSRADTVTVSGTAAATGTTVTATDTKEIQILATNTDITVNGCVPTGNLPALYGAPTVMEFQYNPANIVSSGAQGSVSGSNGASSAFMVISNASNSSIYFEGNVTAEENIYADATWNPLTNTAVSGGTFASTDAATSIFAKIYASQAAFQSGAAPIQNDGINVPAGSLHIGDTFGSVKLDGYLGATGGHLSA